MNPLVSVIIPTYNRAQYIGLAVQSVLRQTYTHLEVLVVDDGSTDNTRQLIEQIQDPRVRYTRTENQGNYFARNVALEQARGEFIAFLDSDDQFVADKLQRQLEKFARMPELGLCCGNAFIRSPESPGRVFEDAAHTFPYDFDTAQGFIERAIKNNFIITSTVMIRYECFKTLGRFDTHYQNAMDYEFFLRIVFNYPAYYMKDKLVEREIHAQGIHKNFLNSKKAVVYILSQRVGIFEQGGLFRDVHKRLLAESLERRKYILGLEYLSRYDFDHALYCLQESSYRRNHAFKILAMFVARYRLGFLIPLIKVYRHYRHNRSQFQKPTT